MTTDLVKLASNDSQIIKSQLSDGGRVKFLPSVAECAYCWFRIDGYLENVRVYLYLNVDFGVSDMARLADKVALISGGAQGQGAAEARAFANEGATVVFGDILDAEGQAVAAEIQAGGGDAHYRHLDVTSEADWQGAVDFATERFGRLDILINNAAVFIPRVPIEERTAEEWDRVMSVNAKGVFLGTKFAIPAMRASGGGSIVNISSIAGIGQSAHQEPAYAASKGAIRIFSKVTATQHAVDKIRCNSVHPGPVDTAMFRQAFADPDALAKRLARVPLNRAGTIEEIVAGVLFLASDESSYVTGTELIMDGGALSM
jgi:cyclopentanol dehydrogenase